MKRHLWTAGIIGLSFLSIFLIAFSFWGLLSLANTGAENAPETHPQPQEQIEPIDTTQKPTENTIYKEGDNPEIKAIINAQINNIVSNTDFLFHDVTLANAYGRVGFSGEHNTTFTNDTGINFGYFKFIISVYDVENPDPNFIANPPADALIKSDSVFSGAFNSGQTIPISFPTDTADYTVWIWTFEYTLPDGYFDE